MNARALCLKLLCALEERGGFANLLLSDNVLEAAGDDGPFLTALFYGTVERRLTLDYLLARFAGRGVDEISPTARRILHIGLYQLFFMNIPPHAAVSQTVALASLKSERGFINAVLRAASREDRMPLPPRERVAKHLSVKHSFPLPTVKRFLSMYGESDTEALLSYYNITAPLCLRARDEKTRDSLLVRYRDDGIAAEKTPYAPAGLRVLSSVPPTSLYGYREGLFFVQDEASQISTEVLAPESGNTVVDVCACPGGKSFGAALGAKGEGVFYAFDLYQSKLPLIESGASRLSLPVTVRCVDATKGDKTLSGCADRVICDVPCSGLGVLGKKPDLRYREINEDLSKLQYIILCRAAEYVKAGGVMVYSTCTLLKEENEENVLRFLSEHPDFESEDFSVAGDRRLDSRNGMLTLLPHLHGTDGFFIARLRKKHKESINV